MIHQLFCVSCDSCGRRTDAHEDTETEVRLLARNHGWKREFSGNGLKWDSCPTCVHLKEMEKLLKFE